MAKDADSTTLSENNSTEDNTQSGRETAQGDPLSADMRDKLAVVISNMDGEIDRLVARVEALAIYTEALCYG
ncbi:MAG: hypothetical protein ACR2OJ_11065, partial [Hyphomicrobiales bacterium]